MIDLPQELKRFYRHVIPISYTITPLSSTIVTEMIFYTFLYIF